MSFIKIFASGQLGTKRLQSKFTKLARKIKNRKPLMNKIGIKLLQQTDRNFKEQGREKNKWKALSPVTIAARRKGPRKGTPKILQDTRRLQSSIVNKQHKDNIYQLSATTVKIGTNVEYAPTHQFGKKKRPRVPKRPFLPSKKRALEIAVETTEKQIERDIKKAGF